MWDFMCQKTIIYVLKKKICFEIEYMLKNTLYYIKYIKNIEKFNGI